MRRAFGKKLFGSRLAQSCCALVAVLAHAAPATAGDLVFFDDQAVFELANVDLGHAQKGVPDFEERTLPPRGGLIWFTDQAEFEVFMQDQGKALKGIEDFEESILGPNASESFDDPLESGVPNLPNGFPFPDGLTGLPNLIVQSNVGGGDPSDENPRGIDGLAAASDGFFGAVSDVVVAIFFEDSFDLIFTDEKSGVGFNTISFFGADEVQVRVYSTTNVFLGVMTSPADATGTNFIGVWSQEPIGRVNIFDRGDGFEGGDNIQTWANCPQIQNVTQGTFHCSIQHAIDTADRGDEIVVQEGTYFETINFLGKAITLRSTDPTDPAVVAATIIDAAGSGRVVLCNSGEGPDTVLSGFTITGGSALNGAGMQNGAGSSPTVTYCTFINNAADSNGGGMRNLNGSSPTVTNCTFSGNSAVNVGGGMQNATNSNPTVTNCTFSGNTTGQFGSGGGMINVGSSPMVTNCTFSGNTATFNGGGMFNGNNANPVVTNCTFSGNSANVGGGMFNDTNANPIVTNCTYSGNSAVGGGMFNHTNANPIVTNCILWGDSPDEISGDGTPIVTYSNVQGGWPGTGNIDADPMFVDPDNDDLRLGNCSPSTDAGDNDAVPGGVTTDLDGNPRFVDDAGVADTGNGDGPIVDMGAYERQDDSASGVVNVPADFATIQEAIDAACPTAEIIVQEGTYFENINFLGKAITLRSTDPTDPAVVAATIIDAAGSGRVVHCNSGEGPDTVLSGFTITGGNAPAGAGMLNNLGSSPTVTYCTFIDNVAVLRGGGMRNNNGSSPTVINCTFSGNSATSSFGGGMNNFTNSSPTVTNCTFSGNTAILGGGMSNNTNSSPTVSNCTFSGNTSSNGGGGMGNVLSSSPTVTNCTFSGNIAGISGGGMSNETGSNATVTNCTFSGNTANGRGDPVGGAIFRGTVANSILWGNSPDEIRGNPTVTYSNVQGGFEGEGNIDADPLFVDSDNDDLRLLPGSPSVDAADNTAPGLAGITEDLDGLARFVDDPDTEDTGRCDDPCERPVVDMGAYEFQADAGGCIRDPEWLCDGDVDGDGQVNPVDSGLVQAAFGSADESDLCQYDIDCDGQINPVDSGIVQSLFGTCEAPRDVCP